MLASALELQPASSAACDRDDRDTHHAAVKGPGWEYSPSEVESDFIKMDAASGTVGGGLGKMMGRWELSRSIARIRQTAWNGKRCVESQTPGKAFSAALAAQDSAKAAEADGTLRHAACAAAALASVGLRADPGFGAGHARFGAQLWWAAIRSFAGLWHVRVSASQCKRSLSRFPGAATWALPGGSFLGRGGADTGAPQIPLPQNVHGRTGPIKLSLVHQPEAV